MLSFREFKKKKTGDKKTSMILTCEWRNVPLNFQKRMFGTFGGIILLKLTFFWSIYNKDNTSPTFSMFF
jgi:hypothetical protein